MTTIRSFVAIDPGADFRSWLAPVTRELAAACGGVRWTRRVGRWRGSVAGVRRVDAYGSLK